MNKDYAFQLMMSSVHAGEVLSLQSSMFCASLHQHDICDGHVMHACICSSIHLYIHLSTHSLTHSLHPLICPSVCLSVRSSIIKRLMSMQLLLFRWTSCRCMQSTCGTSSSRAWTERTILRSRLTVSRWLWILATAPGATLQQMCWNP